MSKYEFVFLLLSVFSMCFLAWYILSAVRKTESNLNDAIAFMRFVKNRNDMERIYTLHKFKEMLNNEGQFDGANKVKMMISKEYGRLTK